jgi:hypothetical protein
MKHITHDFIATITLYPASKGGRQSPIIGEWFGCPCKFDPKDFSAWDCRILNRGIRFAPGTTRHFGVAFLVPEAAAMFRRVKKFYLWEGHIIGEAAANEEPENVTSLMIRLMQNKRAGLTAVEAAAETIAADARFNMWVLDEVKPAGHGEDRWMQLLEFCEQIIQRCEVAAAQFLDGGAHEPLIHDLSAIAADLRTAPATKPFWPA